MGGEQTGKSSIPESSAGGFAQSRGMAEVATEVLHNVGNVLNSVNISATIIAQKIKNSKSAKLAKVVELLNYQRNGELTRFTHRG